MSQTLNALEVTTFAHPGSYDVTVLHGGPVSWFPDGEAPSEIKKSATVKPAGRWHLLAADSALVNVEDHVEKPKSSAKAKKPAKKAAKKA